MAREETEGGWRLARTPAGKAPSIHNTVSAPAALTVFVWVLLPVFAVIGHGTYVFTTYL